MVRLMSCEWKKYHIDEEKEARGVILCVGRRVPCISNAYSWYIMHDTCGQRYLISRRANKPQNMWEFLLHAMLLKYLYLWLEYL